MSEEVVRTSPGRGRSQALVETVHLSLVDALRSGLYRPGDRLREEEVAERLGVSRTPVREAFGRLMAGKLVEPSAGRGLVVRTLGTAEVLELYAMREILEGAAAALAARNRLEAELDALGDLQHRLGDASLPAPELARINILFHAAIVRAARNRYLRQALAELQDAIALLGPTTFSVPGRPAEGAAEHEAILDAIRQGRPDAAEERARAHIRSALRSRLSLMDQ